MSGHFGGNNLDVFDLDLEDFDDLEPHQDPAPLQHPAAAGGSFGDLQFYPTTQDPPSSFSMNDQQQQEQQQYQPTTGHEAPNSLLTNRDSFFQNTNDLLQMTFDGPVVDAGPQFLDQQLAMQNHHHLQQQQEQQQVLQQPPQQQQLPRQQQPQPLPLPTTTSRKPASSSKRQQQATEEDALVLKGHNIQGKRTLMNSLCE